jgi:hypothetical protein
MSVAAAAAAAEDLAVGTACQGAAAAEVEDTAAEGNAADATLQQSGIVHDELRLLRLFLDLPGPSAPFSIHNICRAGAHHG